MSYGLRQLRDPLAEQGARRKFWRQRGFVDGKLDRKPAEGEKLRELGGELALHAYRAGHRQGQLERERSRLSA